MTSLLQRLDSLDTVQRSYTLQTLADHLAAAGQYERLLTLFVDQSWMQARVAFAGYRYDGYITDVEVAAQRARECAGDSDERLVQLFRLCLIRSSVTTRAESAPTPLVAEAVRRGRWSAARAIGIARNRFSPPDATELSWALLTLPNLTRDDLKALEDLARPRQLPPDARAASLAYWQQRRGELEEVRGQWGDREQSDRAIELLLTVHDFLKVSLRVDGVARETSALDVAGRKQRDDVEKILSEMEASDPEETRRLVLSKFRVLSKLAARGYQAIQNVPGFDDSVRREAEALFSHALDPRVLTWGMPKLRDCEMRVDAHAVERIAPFLSAEQSSQLVQEIVGRRRALTKGNPNRARALAALAPRLPESERQQAIDKAIEELAWMLETAGTALRKRVKSGKPAESRAACKSSRAQAHASRNRRTLVFDDYHETDDGIDLSFSAYVEEALDLEIEYGPLEAAVGALALTLPERLVSMTLGLALVPREDYHWVSISAICALVQRLEGTEADDDRQPLLAQAAQCMARLPGELQRWHWPELAPRLDDQQLDEALIPYGGAEDDMAQIRVLGATGMRLTGASRAESVGTAVEIAERLTDPSLKVSAVSIISPALTPDMEARVIAVAFDFASTANQLKAVAALVPHLSVAARTKVLARALRTALDASTENSQEDADLAAAWAELCHQFNEKQRRRAVPAIIPYVLDVQFEYDFKLPVRLLGPYLRRNHVKQLMGFRYHMPEALSVFLQANTAHLLSVSARESLYRRILALADEEQRLEFLAAHAQYTEGTDRDAVVAAAWSLALKTNSTTLLSQLAPSLTESLVTSTFAASLGLSTLQDDDVECALAPRLDDAQKRVLLESVLQLSNSDRRARLLRELAPHLDGSLRTAAATGALAFTNPDTRFSTASSYFASLGADGRPVIGEKLWAAREKTREDVLAVFSTRGALDALSDDAALSVANQVREICRVWQWW